MASLQEQLLKAGMVDKKKAKQITQEKRKQAKQAKGTGKVIIDEGKEAAKRALAEKAERDREMNRLRQAEADKKAIQAQIVQLITLNKIDRKNGEIAYQFTDGKKIKKLYVDALLQTQLIKGVIALVKLKEGYELVPAAIADKIKQRDESVVLVHNTKPANEPVDEDDPYAAYQIPDDLMW
ncbi:MAG: hypothetical protein ACJA1I_001512 [Zhongshania marina]|jgi:uncharacterized protein YaiL (DUF2058 family)|uniref:DUF2058 domain-containing protein n=1 Tax=Zhongshania marina TaxID=2304603 RepID=A0A2S4HBE3_9GAMM|nr:DUF2058 domain-containing protein [Marortus luteolus]POP51041.1 DUF2058 domain-containing protein [Marortus luteolus]RNL60149.1 DUF2058 domain-containing protein [Zhongshania marina]|tara:strand:+ start:112 stop:654 length:543 start_codon:yes stop_codon:yes gene_type:complete